VAFDPEGTVPIPITKLCRPVSEALQRYSGKDGNTVIRPIEKSGSRFQPHRNGFLLGSRFPLKAYASDESFKDTVFYPGISVLSQLMSTTAPFSLLAQNIQVQQYEILKTCLGRDYFSIIPAPYTCYKGFVFLKKMKTEEFLRHSRELKRKAENR